MPAYTLVPATSKHQSSKFQFTTGDTEVFNNEKWVLGPHEITLPANPEEGDSIEFSPLNGDWATLGATFITTDTSTIGSGVPISASSDIITIIYNADTDNWVISN